MKKLKIYLDTSVISHLKQDGAYEKMQDTLILWEDIKAGKYDVSISFRAIDEIIECPQPKRDFLIEFLSQIEYFTIESNSDIIKLAQEIIDMKILSPKSFDDCIHIAATIQAECDYIISWNFKFVPVHFRQSRKGFQFPVPLDIVPRSRASASKAVKSWLFS